jgi:hypothetical protein
VVHNGLRSTLPQVRTALPIEEEERTFEEDTVIVDSQVVLLRKPSDSICGVFVVKGTVDLLNDRLIPAGRQHCTKITTSAGEQPQLLCQ